MGNMNPFGEFCLQHGIVHQTIAPYSPQQNGLAKRKKQNLERYDECNVDKFRFTAELVGGSYAFRQLYS